MCVHAAYETEGNAVISEDEVREREETVGTGEGATPGQVAVDIPKDDSAPGSQHKRAGSSSFRQTRVGMLHHSLLSMHAFRTVQQLFLDCSGHISIMKRLLVCRAQIRMVLSAVWAPLLMAQQRYLGPCSSASIALLQFSSIQCALFSHTCHVCAGIL